MTSYVSRILVLSVMCFCSFSSFGKETCCYKLIETSDSNVKVGAFQFISFIGDQCYESNSNGVSVKNGTLNRNSYKSSNGTIVYDGACFCGSGASFEFKNNKSELTVTSATKKTYRFRKTSKPQGVETCSLIRSHSANGTYTDYDYGGNFINNTVSSDYNNSNNSNNSQSSNYNSHSSQKHRCVYCNGTGQMTKNDNAPANFGNDRPRTQCSTCGEWYDPDVFIHYHIRCRHCGGSGFAK